MLSLRFTPDDLQIVRSAASMASKLDDPEMVEAGGLLTGLAARIGDGDGCSALVSFEELEALVVLLAAGELPANRARAVKEFPSDLLRDSASHRRRFRARLPQAGHARRFKAPLGAHGEGS